ncbi:MAG: hypothetical protein C4524_07340 [Candidatus Zixiibacteriota bacterium]|nr:MAG: hypothetical protein C4524_07340 [candidate division Zixibacteria bacterium]
MGRSQELVKEFDEAYRAAISVWGPWLAEAKKDVQFRLGDQYSSQDKAILAAEQRDPLVFNEVKRVVKLLTGYQRKNRLSLKVDPVEGADERTARQFSGLTQFTMTKGGGYKTLSDAFEHGPVTTGLNLVEVSLNYDLDPLNGDFRFERIPYNVVLLDPYLTEWDLSNCNYALRRKCLSKEDCKAALPAHAKEIGDLSPQGRDGKFPDAPAATNFKGDHLLRFDEFYRRTTKPAKLLVDKLTGNFRIWRGEKPRLDAFLRAPDQETGMNVGDRMAVIDHYVKTVDLAIMVEGYDFYDGGDLLGIDDYPWVPFLGDWVPEYSEMKDKLQGVVRCMRDPNTEKNRRRLKGLDMMDSVISTGFKAEQDAVVSRASLYQTGQGRVIWTQPGKLDKVAQLTGGDLPAGLFKMMEILDQDLLRLPGVEGLLAAPENQNQQIAMGLAKLREAQGLTQQQDLFDNFRFGKSLLGNKLVKAMQVNWHPAKVQRILNEKPQPEFYTRDFGQYDCVASEGLLTDTQRQMFYLQLRELKAQGAPISWKTIIKYAPLETKEELLQEIEAGEKAQGQAAQMELASKQITDKLLQAETASRIAQAREKSAKVRADMARAGLDVARTMAEIQQMDANRLMELLKLALEIERGGGLGLPAPPMAANDKVVPLRRGEMVTRR